MQKNIVKIYVSYEVAKQLKLLNFHVPCFGMYNESLKDNIVLTISKLADYNDLGFVKTWKSSPNDDIVSAPMVQQVVDWIRETYNISIYVIPDWEDGKCNGYSGFVDWEDGLIETDTYNDYYKAFDNAIKNALNEINKR